MNINFHSRKSATQRCGAADMVYMAVRKDYCERIQLPLSKKVDQHTGVETGVYYQTIPRSVILPQNVTVGLIRAQDQMVDFHYGIPFRAAFSVLRSAKQAVALPTQGEPAPAKAGAERRTKIAETTSNVNGLCA